MCPKWADHLKNHADKSADTLCFFLFYTYHIMTHGSSDQVSATTHARVYHINNTSGVTRRFSVGPWVSALLDQLIYAEASQNFTQVTRQNLTCKTCLLALDLHVAVSAVAKFYSSHQIWLKSHHWFRMTPIIFHCINWVSPKAITH